MTFRLRAARPEDIEPLYEMAKLTGGGFTNLPADRNALEAKLARAQAAFDILGKQRVFRALVRLSDAALATAAIIYAAILQLVLSVASWIGNMIFRPAVKTLAHRV